jgi:hypothetical protein
MQILKTKIYTGLPRAIVEYEAKLIHQTAFIFMYDLDGERSLTNDMQAVLKDLKKVYVGIYNATIIYRDSEGCFDQVIVDEGGSFKFCTLVALSEEEAVATSRKLNKLF